MNLPCYIRYFIRYSVVFFFALWLAAFAANPIAAGDGFEVRWVIDGDTVVLTDGRHVRYLGVDTPELSRESRKAAPFSETARRFNRKLVLNRKIRLEWDKERKDRYGRILAYAFLEDETFVNARIVAEGLGHLLVKRPNRRYTQILLNSQRRAMSAGIGIWKGLPGKKGRVIGNTRSARFHQPFCPFGKRMYDGNRKEFKSRWQAYWDGFSPCGRCFPRETAP